MRAEALMNRILPILLTIPALALAAPADLPVAGDLVNGAKLYRLHCAACHGAGGTGDGVLAPGLDPKPGAVRDGALLFAKSAEELLATTLGQNGPKGLPNMHGRGLTALDARDLLAWVRSTVPSIQDIFPGASDYIAHAQSIDNFGAERAEKALGYALSAEDRAIMIFAAFKPADPAEGEKPKAHVGPPRLLPEDPAQLYEAKPKRKIGLIGYVPLTLDGGSFQVALAFNRMMRLVDVRTVVAGDDKSEALRLKYDKLLRSYIGAGGREEKRPVEPQDKGMKAPKDVQAAMLKAYQRVYEGSAMYDKEEKDRFWADPDAFKFPAAMDQPDEVKFEFKTKKGK